MKSSVSNILVTRRSISRLEDTHKLKAINVYRSFLNCLNESGENSFNDLASEIRDLELKIEQAKIGAMYLELVLEGVKAYEALNKSRLKGFFRSGNSL